MKFADLRLIEPLLRVISREGYETATPVQAQSIPLALEGRDVLGCAQTGTGKTAAFALPMLQRLAERTPAKRRRPRGLVLAPTRELAAQIADSFRTYGDQLNLFGTVIFGGVNQNPQVKALRRGVDIIVATPGRLMDLNEQGHVDLRAIEMLVLDEADRMLDMGFIHDIRRIVSLLPEKRQTLFFSATMSPAIRQLTRSLLKDPAHVTIEPEVVTADAIDQSVYFVQRQSKAKLLAHLLHDTPMHRTIVFTRTKHGADRLVRDLGKAKISAAAIHGNKTQNNRQRALAGFAADKVGVLVATDIASRGIDVDGITHVVNYDLTHEPETYIHRIGRTARAGASGCAISFCDSDELGHLHAIERLIGKPIEQVRDDLGHSVAKTDLPNAPRSGGKPQRSRRRRKSHPLDAKDRQHTVRPGRGKRKGNPKAGPKRGHRRAKR